jgi:hypothetical protein
MFNRRRRQAPVASPEGDVRVVLMVKSRTGVRWFDLTTHGITARVGDKLPDDTRLIVRWTDDDHRIVVSRPLTQSQAVSEFSRTHNADFSVINLSRPSRVLYGCPVRAAYGAPIASVPLAYLLDVLESTEQATASVSRPRLCWLQLIGEGVQVMGLVGLNGRTLLSDPAINPQAREEQVRKNALSQVIGGDKLWLDECIGLAPGSEALAARVAEIMVRVDAAALYRAALVSRRRFPREPMVLGVPVGLAQSLALGVGLTVAAFTTASICLQHWQLTQHRQKAALVTREAAGLRDALNERIAARSAPLAHSLSLRPRRLFDAATAVWHPGTSVTLVATQLSSQLNLTLPIQRQPRAALDRSNTLTAVPGEQFARWRATPAPAGWSAQPLRLRGDLDAFTLAFTQGPTDPDLASFVAGRMDSIPGLPSTTVPASRAATADGTGRSR